MLENKNIEKEKINELNKIIQYLVARNRNHVNFIESSFNTKLLNIKKTGPSYFFNYFKNKFNKLNINANIANRKYKILETAINDRSDSNFFSSEKIAVYTCMFGNYDNLIEPHIHPDNIDYYVVTNLKIDNDSSWKIVDVGNFNNINKMSNILKARYFKTHAHELFPNYNYSIYVDANFEIFSDLTEHINRISKIGISMFKHCQRKCVYEEIEACYLLGKIDKKSLKNIKKYLISENMPKNYGLLETGIIVRKHNDKYCKLIMEEWFKEIESNINRDQITLPLVLYKNNICIDNIATLGNNIRDDCSFEINKHIVKN